MELGKSIDRLSLFFRTQFEEVNIETVVDQRVGVLGGDVTDVGKGRHRVQEHLDRLCDGEPVAVAAALQLRSDRRVVAGLLVDDDNDREAVVKVIGGAEDASVEIGARGDVGRAVGNPHYIASFLCPEKKQFTASSIVVVFTINIISQTTIFVKLIYLIYNISIANV